MRDVTKMLILLLLPLLGLILVPSSGALTTFGKTNPQSQNQNPPPQPTPVGKSRICKLESDCRSIPNTTCIADVQDGKTRCLCGDYSAPVNGACTNIHKAVRFPCNDDAECDPNAHCVQKDANPPTKRCTCREGFVEDDLFCSGSSPIFRISLAILFAVSGNIILL